MVEVAEAKAVSAVEEITKFFSNIQIKNSLSGRVFDLYMVLFYKITFYEI